MQDKEKRCTKQSQRNGRGASSPLQLDPAPGLPGGGETLHDGLPKGARDWIQWDGNPWLVGHPYKTNTCNPRSKDTRCDRVQSLADFPFSELTLARD